MDHGEDRQHKIAGSDQRMRAQRGQEWISDQEKQEITEVWQKRWF
jgi:hypothetical protein